VASCPPTPERHENSILKGVVVKARGNRHGMHLQHDCISFASHRIWVSSDSKTPKVAGVSLPLALLVGLVLGLRHAADADHVVAIGAMVREANDLRASVRTGALWGLGHAVTVLGVAAAIAVAGLRVSSGAARLTELAAAAMRVGLGLVKLRAARAPVASRRAGEGSAPWRWACSMGSRAARARSCWPSPPPATPPRPSGTARPSASARCSG